MKGHHAGELGIKKRKIIEIKRIGKYSDNNMNESEIYQEAVKKWGNRSQSDLMIEECSELTQAIIKYRRGIVDKDRVVSEMADVQIMLNQMKVIVGDDSLFEKWMAVKLSRLESLINSSNSLEDLQNLFDNGKV